jgi:predicted DNA-binding transcriptional regulator AlpA
MRQTTYGQDTANLALLRKRELARLLGVSHRTIDRWARMGKLPPAIRLSAHMRAWRLQDIQRWQAERLGVA